MKTFSFHHRASALLLSFFMMSMLVMVGLAVSILVIHDLRASRTELAGAQASYAAEGMTEIGLQLMKDNLPGYEPTSTGDLGVDMASLTVDALSTSGTMPCDGQNDADDGWRKLSQNESIQIPLFAQTTAEGAIQNVQNFYVEFYVDGSTPVTDVLRWKILGMTIPPNSRTEAVSEYIPLVGGQNSSGNPSIFGPAAQATATGYSSGKYYRASYPSVTFPTYSIQTFLQGHEYNYLVLTNVVTTSTNNAIYFKYHGVDELPVCEYTQLNSSAELTSEQVRQELVTLVKEGQNLPVFDFVIYHTGKQTP